MSTYTAIVDSEEEPLIPGEPLATMNNQKHKEAVKVNSMLVLNIVLQLSALVIVIQLFKSEALGGGKLKYTIYIVHICTK